jgi:hypothetical protein
MTDTIRCERCGTEVPRKRRAQRWCSPQCRSAEGMVAMRARSRAAQRAATAPEHGAPVSPQPGIASPRSSANSDVAGVVSSAPASRAGASLSPARSGGAPAAYVRVDGCLMSITELDVRA